MATTGLNRVLGAATPQQPLGARRPVSGRAGEQPELLHVSVRPEGDSDVIVLLGELDFATAPKPRSAIDQLLITGRKRIAVDLDAVTFVDAAAIDAVITATCAVVLAGGTLRITPNPSLMLLLECTRETHCVDVARAAQNASDQ